MTIKTILKKVLSIITDVKIYMGRTMSWISMANSLMLVFLVIERLNNLGVIKGDLGNSFFVVVGSWFCILVALGWFEVNKIRAPHLESEKILEFNLPLKEIRDRIREIDERTKKIEKDIEKNTLHTKPLKSQKSGPAIFDHVRCGDDIRDKDKNVGVYGQHTVSKETNVTHSKEVVPPTVDLLSHNSDVDINDVREDLK